VLLNGLEKREVIAQTGAEVRLAGHKVVLAVDEQEMEARIGRLYADAGLAPPILKEVVAALPEFPEKRIRQVLDLLAGKGQLVRINEALLFDASALEQLGTDLTAYLRRQGEIDAQGFKELTGLTRKFSIPLLEYFDKRKLTLRIGDKRVLRKG
jgi:selenocysteine-specific elongation factor